MTTTPETPALPGDLTDETIERAAIPIFEAITGHAFTDEYLGSREWAAAGETASAVLAAARVAPTQCGEQHPFMSGACVLPVGHEPGHMCAPVTPSPDLEKVLAEAEQVASHIDLAGSDLARRTIQQLIAALAVPPVVNEEKLAEVIARAMPGWNDDTTEPGLSDAHRAAAEAHWERVNEECLRQGREYARAVIERQREWLRDGR